MALPVKLKDAVAELEMAGPESSGFVNRTTGDLITLSDEDFDLAESNSDILSMPEWQQEVAALAKEVRDNDDYIALPGQFEIHEYSIMERFCLSVENQRLQDVLLRAIKGRGAFRAFKDRIVEEDVRDDWFTFRDAALKEIVVEFLTFEKIPFVDAQRKFIDHWHKVGRLASIEIGNRIGGRTPARRRLWRMWKESLQKSEKNCDQCAFFT